FLERVVALVRALPSWRGPDLGLGLLTLGVLALWPRFARRVPAAIVALTASAVLAWLLSRLVPGLEAATITSRFRGIPRPAPGPVLPWQLPGPRGEPLVFSFDLVHALLPAAFAIAMLGALESLLSAVVADGMTGRRHDPDSELVAQGIGNLVAPFFGGIAATGAIARTATNIRAGARSPIAAAIHSLFVLGAVLVFAPWLGYLPMASLSALL